MVNFSNKKRPAAAAVIEGDNFAPIARTSVKGSEGKYFNDINSMLKNILDEIPISQRSNSHGKCAEIKAISDILNKKYDSQIVSEEEIIKYFKNSKSKAVNIKGTSKTQFSHGKYKCACKTCKRVLDVLDINEVSH